MTVRLYWMVGALAIAGAIAAGVAFVKANKRDHANLEQLEGVWQSRGYGWIWAIEDGKIRIFDRTASFCTEQRNRKDALSTLGDKFYIGEDSNTLRVPIYDPTYLITFDRLSSLPDACNDDPDTDPVTIFRAAAELFSAHYAFFEERGVDWPARVAKYGKEVTSDMDADELFETLSKLIAPIDDGHVNLRGRVDGDRRRYAPENKPRPVPSSARQRAERIGYWTKGIGPKLVTSRLHQIGDKEVLYGLIGDDIGYLYAQSTDSDLASAIDGGMDEARELFRNARALVIDLSGNDGGLDLVARKFASLFATQRVLAYYKYAGDAHGEAPQAVYVEPGKTPLYTGPIVLITDRATLSAAEILTMCLRALPNVTHIGETTQGSLSDELEKDLPNGWTLSLSNEIYLDSERKAWEGKGIPPRIPFMVHDEDGAPGDPVQAALAMINFVLSQHNEG